MFEEVVVGIRGDDEAGRDAIALANELVCPQADSSRRPGMPTCSW
jgi:hypothetical protein